MLRIVKILMSMRGGGCLHSSSKVSPGDPLMELEHFEGSIIDSLIFGCFFFRGDDLLITEPHQGGSMHVLRFI